MPESLLQIRDLSLAVGLSGQTVVDDVSLVVGRGEIVGIVGESGSGKTMVARAALALTPPAIRQTGGRVLFEGRDIARMSPREMRALRGDRIGMVFQEPMTSLNPSMTIGRQLEEGLALHRPFDAAERRRRILAMLARVGIADPEGALAAYPHQFSGGMRQRIMLASVMLLEPVLLVADEPTTALDAVVQREVLELMVELTQAHGTAVLLISHDLSMVARYTGRAYVMSAGRVVEEGPTEDLLGHPRDPYTRRLLAAMPRRATRPPVAPSGQPIVTVDRLVVEFPGRRGGAAKRALDGVALAIEPGEVVALVGGSGSGKTTLGRTIAGLIRPSSGQVLFRGRPIADQRGAEWRDYRLATQMVFQDPYSSLDPRMTIGGLVGEPLRHSDLGRAERRRRVDEVLDEVGLGSGFAERYPHELSGGQRQRIAIARAVVRRPALVVADEPVSALDMTVRAQVLDLFADLQARHGFACLFISHDLGVVEQVADRIVVMNEGRIVEEGTRDAVMDHPQDAYTRTLLSAIPTLETTLEGGVRLKWRFDEPVGTTRDDRVERRPAPDDEDVAIQDPITPVRELRL